MRVIVYIYIYLRLNWTIRLPKEKENGKRDRCVDLFLRFVLWQ